jgi:hypothetical protein
MRRSKYTIPPPSQHKGWNSSSMRITAFDLLSGLRAVTVAGGSTEKISPSLNGLHVANEI